MRLNPNYDEPHYHLGLIYRVDKQLDKARDEFETAIRLNPQNSKAHGNLGFIFASIGEFEAAEQHLRMAIQLNPNDNLAIQLLTQIRAAKANGTK
jgi:protein O-mannosyl-transferase